MSSPSGVGGINDSNLSVPFDEELGQFAALNTAADDDNLFSYRASRVW